METPNEKSSLMLIENDQSTYEMNFANNDDQPNQNKPSNNQPNNSNNRGKNRGFFSIAFLVVALIIILALMLYFFVVPSTNGRSVTFREADVTYRIDTNGDNVPDLTQEGYPDFGNHSSDNGNFSYDFSIKSETNPNGIIMDDSSLGDLARLLLTPETSQITLVAAQSNVSDEITYLSGNFKQLNQNGKVITYSYQASIHTKIYDLYVFPIINNVTITNAETGEITKYYTGDRFQTGVESSSNVASWLFPTILAIITIVLIVFFFGV